MPVCCHGVAWVLPEVSPGCCQRVAWVLTGCFRGVAWVLPRCCLGAARGVAKVLHGCCRGVGRFGGGRGDPLLCSPSLPNKRCAAISLDICHWFMSQRAALQAVATMASVRRLIFERSSARPRARQVSWFRRSQSNSQFGTSEPLVFRPDIVVALASVMACLSAMACLCRVSLSLKTPPGT